MAPGKTLRLRSAALTHVGLRRAKNEDCIAIDTKIISESMMEPWVTLQTLDRPRICLVADGMGGHPAGDVASRLATEHMSARFAELGTDEHAIVAAIHGANRALFTQMARSPSCYGMGTTLAGVVAHANGLTLLNVGDSRIYSFHLGKLDQLSIDDSIELGTATVSSRAPARMLDQCLGGFADGSEIEPHLVHLELAEGRTFLICSDGLHDMISDRDIEACLGDDLERSVSLLFEAAMERGGIDNISVIYTRIERTEAVE